MENKRRTQADRSAATRAALIAAGRSLFAQHGFAAVGTPAIVGEAGVTRGALYHQFEDKTELFAAVFEQVEEEVMARVLAGIAAAEATDPLAAMLAAAEAWLEIAAEPEVNRIVLVEAPAALGWDRWREIGQKYAMGATEALIAQAVSEGAIPDQPIKPLAHVLVGALDEAALYVARADDQEAARAAVKDILRRLIRAMALPD